MTMQTGTGLTLCAVLALASNAALALGLGEAQPRSFLGQALDVKIRLISRSEAELATVTAGLASVDDYRIIGLDRANLTVPVEFEVVPDLQDPHILVSSQAPVSDPALQLVVEVVWSSGRMLRQYTIFLDPPTFESAAPLPQTSPAGPPERPLAETPTPEAVPAPEQDTPGEPEAIPPPPPVTAESPAPGVMPPVAEETPPPATEPMGETLASPDDEPEPPTDEVFRAVIPDSESSGEVYGPVQSGETLWGIASRWGQQRGHSTNQVMLAIQQQNPGAFNRGNINSLQRGAILRMPNDGQVRQISYREAMLEVMRQEEIYRNRWALPATTPEVPAVATTQALEAGEVLADPAATASPGDATSPTDEAVTDEAGPGDEEALEDATLAAVEDTRLELVPPAEAAESDEPVMAQGNAADPGEESGESVVAELARTQEELANARQENSYLSERIQELETELSSRNAPTGVGLEDSGLAELEQSLREDRESGAREAREVAVTPPREDPPWYGRILVWLVVLGAVLLAGFVWWLRSQRRLEEAYNHVPVTPPADADKDGDSGEEPSAQGLPARSASQNEDEEAVELDSTDPETKLDLARAYVSMGDNDAARNLLTEVLESGSEDQVREARDMLEEL